MTYTFALLLETTAFEGETFSFDGIECSREVLRTRAAINRLKIVFSVGFESEASLCLTFIGSDY